jgi:hypothetical protein
VESVIAEVMVAAVATVALVVATVALVVATVALVVATVALVVAAVVAAAGAAAARAAALVGDRVHGRECRSGKRRRGQHRYRSALRYLHVSSVLVGSLTT